MASGNVTRVEHFRYIRNVQVKANAVIAKNDIVLTQDADGYAIPGADSTANCKCIGIAMQDVDATGVASGAKTIDVEQGIFLLSNSGSNPATIADIAKKTAVAYCEGVETVGHVSTGRSPVGVFVGMGWENLSGVQVRIES